MKYLHLMLNITLISSLLSGIGIFAWIKSAKFRIALAECWHYRCHLQEWKKRPKIAKHFPFCAISFSKERESQATESWSFCLWCKKWFSFWCFMSFGESFTYEAQTAQCSWLVWPGVSGLRRFARTRNSWLRPGCEGPASCFLNRERWKKMPVAG